MQQDKSFFKFVILSAVISGLASVFTLYLASYSALLFFIFSFFVILPVITVSLIKGIRAGAITTIIALIFSCFALPLSFAISLFISLLLPALYISFMLSIVGIRRDTKEANWVPLSSILFNICIICVVVVVLLAGFIDTILPQPLLSDATFAMAKSFFDANILKSMNSLGLSADEIAQFKQSFDDNFVLLIIATLTWSVIGSLFTMLLLAVYSAARFVAEKQLSPRPRNFWPTDLIMPTAGIAVFFVSAALCIFFPMNFTLLLCMIALVIAFSLGFFVSGLAFIHRVTIGKQWRIVALAVTYMLLFSFIFSTLATIIIIGLGVASTALRAINDRNQQPPSINKI